MATLSIHLLGPFHVTLGAKTAEFGYDQVRALLAYLAMEADRPHSRAALAGLLWPDQPERTARNNLRQALSKLRQAIGDPTATPPFLLISPDTVQFNRASDYWLDVAAFTAPLETCAKHSHRSSERCRSCAERRFQAMEQFRGDFLAQFFLKDSAAFEEWVLVKRERLRQMAFEALDNLATYHEQRRAYEEALSYARRQLELDPWREEAHRQAMRLLALTGQRSAALTQYETCRRILAEELRVDPSDETEALYKRISSGETLAPVAASASHLPQPLTPLVGRQEEVLQILELLETPSCRLVTLVGPGGIGKTRLAIHAAAEAGYTFTDGTGFVPLAGLPSHEFLVVAIADALQLTLAGPEGPETQLVRYLHEREMLLVLDGFEPLLEGASLLAKILEGAPRVALLVTSQERLRLQAEWVLEVRGLEYPASEQVEEAERYSAVGLFLQRARMVGGAEMLTGAETPEVVRICRLVEGMPLGIELAAAWAGVMSCGEIAREVERSLDLLHASLRDLPARHRSMRAAFEYSWGRLNKEEQRVFRSLSVFRGGFQPEAAEEVAGATLAVLATLVEKSLLRRSPTGRYDLHELVRQFAQGKLVAANGEIHVTRSRHATFFVHLAETAYPELTGPRLAEWLKRLEQDHDNLRAVLTWSLEQKEEKTGEVPPSEMGLRLAGTLWRFWEMRGYFDEGRRWLETLLADTSDRTAVHAKALNAAGTFAFDQGDYALARMRYEEALSIRRELGDRPGTAACLNNLGNVALDQGDYARARALYEESLVIRRELNDKEGSGVPLYNLGITTARQGDHQAARSFYEQSRELFAELGDRQGYADAIGSLGTLAEDLGDHTTARVQYEASLTIYRELGDKRGMARCIHNLGLVACRLGESEKARSHLAEALAARQELGDKQGIAETLEGFAELSAEVRPHRAAQLLAAAQNLRQTIGAPLSPVDHAGYEEVLGTIRSKLDEASFAADWDEGSAMTLEQAIEYAAAHGGKS